MLFNKWGLWNIYGRKVVSVTHANYRKTISKPDPEYLRPPWWLYHVVHSAFAEFITFLSVPFIAINMLWYCTVFGFRHFFLSFSIYFIMSCLYLIYWLVSSFCVVPTHSIKPMIVPDLLGLNKSALWHCYLPFSYTEPFLFCVGCHMQLLPLPHTFLVSNTCDSKNYILWLTQHVSFFSLIFHVLD